VAVHTFASWVADNFCPLSMGDTSASQLEFKKSCACSQACRTACMAHQLMCSHLRLLHDWPAGAMAAGITLAAVKHQDNMFTQLQHAGIRLRRQRLPFAHNIASTEVLSAFGITGKMTGSELAAAKTEADMLIWLQHTGIGLCTDRHCPSHTSKLSQMYRSV